MKTRSFRRAAALAALAAASTAVALAAPATSMGYYYAYDFACADQVRWEFHPPLKALPDSGTVTISKQGGLRCAQAGATVYDYPPGVADTAESVPSPPESADFEYTGNCGDVVLSGITYPAMYGQLSGSTAVIAGVRDPWSVVGTQQEVHELLPSATASRSAAPPDLGDACRVSELSGLVIWNWERGGYT